VAGLAVAEELPMDNESNNLVRNRTVTKALLIPFSPGLSHSVAGLLSTVVNIYTARSGFWSRTAISTAAATGTTTAILLSLFLVFQRLLKRVTDEHERIRREAENRGRRR
jgi:hypothetical protein